MDGDFGAGGPTSSTVASRPVNKVTLPITVPPKVSLKKARSRETRQPSKAPSRKAIRNGAPPTLALGVAESVICCWSTSRPTRRGI